MIAEFILGVVVALALLVYLAAAFARPEDF
jgi:K+-transporting ATPase KdpF subunit